MLFISAESRVFRLVLPAIFLASTSAIIIFTLYQAYFFSTNGLLGSDEAHYIIASTTNFFNATTYSEYSDALFSHHANHLLLGMQFLSIGSYYLFGAISIKAINLFCTLLLVLSGLTLICSKYATWQHRVYLAAIVFPVILTPSHNTCMLSAACTANHYFGLALGVISLYFFSRSRQFFFFVLAEISMIISMYSFASGALLFAPAFLFLFLSRHQNRLFYCVSHVLISILLLSSYYFFISPVEALPAELSGVSGFLRVLLQMLFWFIGVSGYAFFWLANDYGIVLFLLGLFLVCSTCVYTWRKRQFILQHQLFIFLGMLYCLSTIAVIASGRYFSFQPTGRYSLYAAFYLAFFLALLCDKYFYGLGAKHFLPLKTWLIPFVVVIYYCIGFKVHYPDAIDLHQRGLICEKRWKNHEYPNQKGASCAQFMKVDKMQKILDRAIAEGIFDPAK